MARTPKTQTPAPRTPDEIIDGTFTINKTALFNDAHFSNWMVKNSSREMATTIDRTIESLERAADELKRHRARIGAAEWAETEEQVAEHAIHEVNWMLANLDEDGLLRQTRELTAARARYEGCLGTMNLTGLRAEWDAKLAEYEAREA